MLNSLKKFFIIYVRLVEGYYMGIQKLVIAAKNIAKKVVSKTAQRASSKAVCSTPVKIAPSLPDEFIAASGKKSVKALKKTASQVTKASSQPKLYDLTKTNLLPDTKYHPLYNGKHIADEGTVLVHMTDHPPETGSILTDRAAYKGTRSSVHTAVNHAVEATNDGMAAWNDCKYAIIMPFAKTLEVNPKGTFVAGLSTDLFTNRSIRLPRGAVIVRQSKKVPKGKLRVRNARDIKRFRHLKGVKVFETSELPHSQVGTILEKMGYTPIKGVNPMYGGFSGQGKDLAKEMKAWKNFADRHGIIPAIHSETPNFSAECLLDFLQYENMGGISLDIVRNGNNFSFRGMLLNFIEALKAHSKATGIPISYDIDKLENIIKRAKTFSDISKGIKKDIKLKSLLTHNPRIRKQNIRGIPVSETQIYHDLRLIEPTPEISAKYQYHLNNPTENTVETLEKLSSEKISQMKEAISDIPQVLDSKTFHAALRNQKLCEQLVNESGFKEMFAKIIYH